jgi:hypothetical protein
MKGGHMKIPGRILLAACSGLLVLSFASCQKEGPAEQAGKKIDKAMEETQKKLEEAGGETGEK